MFTRSKFAVMNADDSHSAELLRGINIPSITYGIRCEKADVRAADIEICARNIEFEMLTPNGNKQINVSIPGLFNVFNAMLAASVCMKLGIDLDTIAEGLKSVKGVSGRMESLPAEGFDFPLYWILHTHRTDCPTCSLPFRVLPKDASCRVRLRRRQG